MLLKKQTNINFINYHINSNEYFINITNLLDINKYLNYTFSWFNLNSNNEEDEEKIVNFLKSNKNNIYIKYNNLYYYKCDKNLDKIIISKNIIYNSNFIIQTLNRIYILTHNNNMKLCNSTNINNYIKFYYLKLISKNVNKDNSYNLIYNLVNYLYKNISNFNHSIYLVSLNSIIIKLTNYLFNYNNFEYSLANQLILFNKKTNKKFINFKNIFKNILRYFELEDNLKINIKNTMNYDDKKYDNSKELYHSVITHTNWVDEFDNGCIMGLLIDIYPNNTKYNYDYDKINIKNISHSIVSLDELLEAYTIYHKNNLTYDNEFLDTNIISGCGIGEGNAILPLYINKQNFKNVKLYLNNVLGIILNKNSLITNEKFQNIYYKIFLKMLTLSLTDTEYKSEKWIYIFFSVFRTTYELTKKKLKNINIKNIMNENINEIIFHFFTNNLYDDIFNIIMEEMFRRKMKYALNSICCLENLFNFNIHNCFEYLHKKNNNITNYNNFLQFLENKIDLINLIKEILSIYNFKQFLNNIDILKEFKYSDENGGIISSSLLKKFRLFISTNFVKPVNSKLNILINKKFTKHINKSKIYKFKFKS